MASSRDIINIQSLNELTSEKDLRGQYVVKGFARFCVLAFASFQASFASDKPGPHPTPLPLPWRLPTGIWAAHAPTDGTY